MAKDKIYAVVKHPDERIGHIMEVDNTLKAFQEVVGGRIVQIPFTPDVVIICNEEGKLLRLPFNCHFFGDCLVGTIMAVGIRGDDFTDIPIDLSEWEELLTRWAI